MIMNDGNAILIGDQIILIKVNDNSIEIIESIKNI